MKPDDISQEVWSKYCDDAAKALDKMPEEGPQLRSHRVWNIARAIQRAVKREREEIIREALEIVEPYTRVSSLHNYGPAGLSRVEEAEIRTGTFIHQDLMAAFDAIRARGAP